jgi:hypothetical protein
MSEQPAAGAHFCSACGQVHGNEGRNVEVQLAKINRDADIEIARIQRGETRTAMEIGAETDIAVAEIHATAGVAETEALAESIAGSGEPDPPVIIDAPAQDIEPEVQASIEPRDDDESGPPAEPKKSGLSYWP